MSTTATDTTTPGRRWPESLPPIYGTPDTIGPVLDALKWGPMPLQDLPAPIFRMAMARTRWARRCAVGSLPLTDGRTAELYGIEGHPKGQPIRAFLAVLPDSWSEDGAMIAWEALPMGATDIADAGDPAAVGAVTPAELPEPIGSASYNITDDKIRLSLDRRLDADEYAAAKAAGFTFWHGSKLFVAKWSPTAEDFATRLAGEIEDDDTPDDVEGRVNRFARYQQGAERAADSAQSYAERIMDGIPAGQPILVGHHSERHARRDKKRIDSALRRAVAEGERAAHWRRRIEGAISRAAYRESPGVIARRIKGLEAEERRAVKRMSPPELFASVLHGASTYRDGRTTYDLPKALRIWAGGFEHARRWRDHVRARLEYERALLAAVGGHPAEGAGKPWEVGGAVLFQGGWRELLKVNRVTFQARSRGGWGDHIKYQKSEAAGLMTRAEFEAYQRGEFDPAGAAHPAPATEAAVTL